MTGMENNQKFKGNFITYREKFENGNFIDNC